MDHLDKLESQSIYIIREAYKQFKNIAVANSVKDTFIILSDHGMEKVGSS